MLQQSRMSQYYSVQSTAAPIGHTNRAGILKLKRQTEAVAAGPPRVFWIARVPLRPCAAFEELARTGPSRPCAGF
jgi:hypothetical protein